MSYPGFLVLSTENGQPDILVVSGTDLVSHANRQNESAEFFRIKETGLFTPTTLTSTGKDVVGVGTDGTAFCLGATDGSILYSPDGVTFSVVKTGLSGTVACFAWTGTKWLAGGGSGTGSGFVVESMDGVTWSSPIFTGHRFLGLHVDNGSGSNIFAAADASIMYSADSGLTWAAVYTDSGGSTALGIAGGRISGTYWYAAPFVNGNVVTSTAPTAPSWSVSTTVTNPRSIAWIEPGFAVGALSGVIKKTVNGSTWSDISLSSTEGVYAIATTQYALYACGVDTGIVYSSINGGTTWSTISGPYSKEIHGIVATEKLLIVAGSSGLLVSAYRQFSTYIYTSAAARASETGDIWNDVGRFADTPTTIVAGGILTFELAEITSSDLPVDFEINRVPDEWYDPQPVFVERESLKLNQDIGKRNGIARGQRTSFSGDLTNKGEKPSGEVVYTFRSSDVLKPLLSHFQSGTCSGSTARRYTFYTNVAQPRGQFDGIDFSNGSYGAPTDSFYTVRVVKKLTDGTPYVFKNGFVDKIEFLLGAEEDAKISCNFMFTDYSVSEDYMDTPSGSFAGTYASELSFNFNEISVLIDGESFPIDLIQFGSDQAAQELTTVGARNPKRYLMGGNTTKGKLGFDLPTEAMDYVADALAFGTFGIVGTMYHGTSDRLMFSMPNCVRSPVDFTANDAMSPKGEIAFEAFAQSGVPSLSITVDTEYAFVPMVDGFVLTDDPAEGDTLIDEPSSHDTLTDDI